MRNQIDHIIYTASNLEEGMDHIEALFGIRPVVGGQHPKWGTHNALLSLGNAYLEILAPDPSLAIPARGLWMSEQFKSQPQLSTWVLQTDSIELLREKVMSDGIAIGPIESGKRQKPNGDWLKWQLTDPYALPLGGALPFLISWGDTLHPSQSVPQAGELLELTIYHPNTEEVKEKISSFGISISVEQAEEPKLTALIQGNKGLVQIQ